MSRHSGTREASRLGSRLEALNDARELAGGVVPDDHGFRRATIRWIRTKKIA